VCSSDLVLALLSPAAARAELPNVLLFVTDDQAVSTLPFMPAVNSRLDVRFTRAYDTTPLCCPSRASIYSGQYAHNHGVFINNGRGFNDARTFFRDLHFAGYRMALVGKYLNGVPARAAPYFDTKRSIRIGNTADATAATAFTLRFLEETEADDDQPWLLVVAGNSPHRPYDVQPLQPRRIPPFTPDRAWDEADRTDKHPAVQAIHPGSYGAADATRAWTGQMRELQAVDEEVDRIFGRLRPLRESTRTLSFYISDNGWLFGEHRLAGKQWPYEPSIQVPFMMRWDGHTHPGATDPRLVANVDIAATIYDATGITPNHEIDGYSLLDPRARDYLYLESDRVPGGMPDWEAIRTPNRYYVRWADGFVEDYNLARDPFELAASNVPDPAIELAIKAARICKGPACP